MLQILKNLVKYVYAWAEIRFEQGKKGREEEGGDESATDSRSVFGLVAGIHKQLHYRVFVC